jgi:hypothetical protein
MLRQASDGAGRGGIAALEQELEHARAIAAVSIGQPDRAVQIAYREHTETKLRSAESGQQ